MSDLDKILHKRLARIRDELNFYISHQNHDQSAHILPDSITEDTSEEPMLGGVQDKFLQSMKLVEEDFDESSEKQEWRWDIDKVLRRKGESFSETLLRLIDEKGLKDSEAYKRANVDRRLFSQIRSSKEYMPSKKQYTLFANIVLDDYGEGTLSK